MSTTTVELPDRCPKCGERFDSETTLTAYIHKDEWGKPPKPRWIFACDECGVDVMEVGLHE